MKVPVPDLKLYFVIYYNIFKKKKSVNVIVT